MAQNEAVEANPNKSLPEVLGQSIEVKAESGETESNALKDIKVFLQIKEDACDNEGEASAVA